MAEEYYRKSAITGRTYNLFNAVRILNTAQVAFYLNKGIPLQDMAVSEEGKNGRPVLVFYFDKTDTWDAYQEWKGMKGK